MWHKKFYAKNNKRVANHFLNPCMQTDIQKPKNQKKMLIVQQHHYHPIILSSSLSLDILMTNTNMYKNIQKNCRHCIVSHLTKELMHLTEQDISFAADQLTANLINTPVPILIILSYGFEWLIDFMVFQTFLGY